MNKYTIVKVLYKKGSQNQYSYHYVQSLACQLSNSGSRTLKTIKRLGLLKLKPYSP